MRVTLKTSKFKMAITKQRGYHKKYLVKITYHSRYNYKMFSLNLRPDVRQLRTNYNILTLLGISPDVIMSVQKPCYTRVEASNHVGRRRRNYRGEISSNRGKNTHGEVIEIINLDHLQFFCSNYIDLTGTWGLRWSSFVNS